MSISPLSGVQESLFARFQGVAYFISFPADSAPGHPTYFPLFPTLFGFDVVENCTRFFFRKLSVTLFSPVPLLAGSLRPPPGRVFNPSRCGFRVFFYWEDGPETKLFDSLFSVLFISFKVESEPPLFGNTIRTATGARSVGFPFPFLYQQIFNVPGDFACRLSGRVPPFPVQKDCSDEPNLSYLLFPPLLSSFFRVGHIFHAPRPKTEIRLWLDTVIISGLNLFDL